MPSLEHKHLIGQIVTLDFPPLDGVEFYEWIKGGEHLRFLQENARSNEHVVYGLDYGSTVTSALGCRTNNHQTALNRAR